MSTEFQNPIFFEQVLIKFLLTNKEITEKILPYLTLNVFDDKLNIDIVKDFLAFSSKYNKTPTLSELKLNAKSEDVFNRLKEIVNLDLSDYTYEYIIELIEMWFKGKKCHEINAEIAEALNEGEIDKVNSLGDKLKEAGAFSFNVNIGLDIFESEEGEEIYNDLHQEDKAISSGIKSLDLLIDGGFHERTLTVFVAPVNTGKSLILNSLAVNSVLQNKNVLYITCEMSKQKITQRTIANMFDIELNNLKHLSKNDFTKKYKEIRKILKSKLIVEEYVAKTLNANHIRSLLRELKTKKKFVPDIMFVDYLEILAPIHKGKGDSSFEIVKNISEELRGVSQEFIFPILTASQTKREGINAAELDLTDISQSIGTAFTADIVIGATQPEEFKSMGKYIWQLMKNRYGEKGIKLPINVDFPKMRVYDDEDAIVQSPRSSNSQKQNAKVNDIVDNITGFMVDDLNMSKQRFDFD